MGCGIRKNILGCVWELALIKVRIPSRVSWGSEYIFENIEYLTRYCDIEQAGFSVSETICIGRVRILILDKNREGILQPEHSGDGASQYGVPGVCLWMGGGGGLRIPEPPPSPGVRRARQSPNILSFLFLPGILLRVLLSLTHHVAFSPGAQNWCVRYAPMDSPLRLTLSEMTILGSVLGHDKCRVYNFDQILNQTSWWVLETSSVYRSLQKFSSAAGCALGRGCRVLVGLWWGRAGDEEPGSLCPSHLFPQSLARHECGGALTSS